MNTNGKTDRRIEAARNYHESLLGESDSAPCWATDEEKYAALVGAERLEVISRTVADVVELAFPALAQIFSTEEIMAMVQSQWTTLYETLACPHRTVASLQDCQIFEDKGLLGGEKGVAKTVEKIRALDPLSAIALNIILADERDAMGEHGKLSRPWRDST